MKEIYINNINKIIKVISKQSFKSENDVKKIISLKSKVIKIVKIKFIFYYLCKKENIPPSFISKYFVIDRSSIYCGYKNVIDSLDYPNINTKFYINCINSFNSFHENNKIISDFEDDIYNPLEDEYYNFKEFLIHSKTKKALRDHKNYKEMKKNGVSNLEIAVKYNKSYNYIRNLTKNLLIKNE